MRNPQFLHTSDIGFGQHTLPRGKVKSKAQPDKPEPEEMAKVDNRPFADIQWDRVPVDVFLRSRASTNFQRCHGDESMAGRRRLVNSPFCGFRLLCISKRHLVEQWH
jgi:hypothetical protein